MGANTKVQMAGEIGTPTSSGVAPAQVYRAFVTGVDTVRHTVDLMPEDWTLGPLADQEFLSPYLNAYGAGITVMPEIGSICYISSVSTDPHKWVVFAYGSVKDDKETNRLAKGSLRNQRPLVNPGDIRIASRSGNEIRVMNGGVIRVKSSGLSQRLYLPISNLIRDFCERYELKTLAGELLFEVEDSARPKPDGEYSTRFKLLVRESTNDPKPIGELVIGEQPQGVRFSLLMRQSGSDTGGRGAVEAFKMTIDKDGRLSVGALDSVTVKGKSVDVVTSNGVKQVEPGLINIDSEDAVMVAATNRIDVLAPQIVLGTRTGASAGSIMNVLTVEAALGGIITADASRVRMGSGKRTRVMLASMGPTGLVDWITKVSAALATLTQGAFSPPNPAEYISKTTESS